MYEVRLAKEADKFFSSAHEQLKGRLQRVFSVLEHSPRRHNNIKPLKGRWAGLWRYRMGDYRIIYEIDHRVVNVLLIDTRGDIYDP